MRTVRATLPLLVKMPAAWAGPLLPALLRTSGHWIVQSIIELFWGYGETHLSNTTIYLICPPGSVTASYILALGPSLKKKFAVLGQAKDLQLVKGGKLSTLIAGKLV